MYVYLCMNIYMSEYELRCLSEEKDELQQRKDVLQGKVRVTSFAFQRRTDRLISSFFQVMLYTYIHTYIHRRLCLLREVTSSKP